MFGKNKNLYEAIRQDDVAQVTNIASHMKLQGKKVYREACLLAVENNKSKALEALFLASGHPFYFCPTSGDREAALKLVKAASSSSDPVPLLSVLWDANKTTSCGRLNVSDFLNKNMPVELIQSILQKDPESFDDCIKYTGLPSTTENLGLILAYTPKGAVAQAVLDKALVKVAAAGEVEKASVLLNHNANPDYDDAKSLLCAAEKKAGIGMIDLLLPRVNLQLYGDDIILKLQAKEEPDAGIIDYIKAAIEKAVPQPQEIDGFTRVDDHTLSLTQALPGGTPLTIQFNLLLQQQFFIKTVDGAPVIDKVVSFDDINPKVVAGLQEKLDTLNHKASPTRLRV